MKIRRGMIIFTAVLTAVIWLGLFSVSAEEDDGIAKEGEAIVFDEEDAAVLKEASAIDSGMISGRSGIAKLSMDEIRALYASVPEVTSLYAVEPIVSGANYRPSVLTDAAYANALGWINYYRSCAGLGTVTLSEEANLAASYGALVNAMNKQLSHYPAQPAEMSDADFLRASEATSSSNLSMWGSSYDYTPYILETAVSGQMADKSGSNIGTLGHRRWLLNPNLLTTGVGNAKNGTSYYTDIEVFGNTVSTTVNSDYDFISWPASGKNLTETFAGDVPWSVTLNPNRYSTPNAADTEITLTCVNNGKTWTFNAGLDQGFFAVETSGYGVSNCIIFRPPVSEVSEYVGQYEVTVTGIKDRSGKAAPLQYSVEFAPYDSDISHYSIELESTIWKYTGNAITPAVSVQYGELSLVRGTDYTVSYSNNTEPGMAAVTISGTGNYSGTVTKPFEITKDNFVIFNANGGHEAPDAVLLTNNTAVIPSAIPVLESMNFMGWAEDPSASEAQYLPGDTVTSSSDRILYAVWAEPFKILPDQEPAGYDIFCAGQVRYFTFVPEYNCSYELAVTGACFAEIHDESSGSISRRSTTSPGGFQWLYTYRTDTAYKITVRFTNETQTGDFTLGMKPMHERALTKEAVAPTCTEDGSTAEYACSVCGLILTPSEVVPALGHEWDEGTTIREAACTEPGTILYTCLHDPSHTQTREIPAHGHELVLTEAVSPTCEEAGNSAYWTCGSCGKIFADDAGITEITAGDTILSPTGHVYGEWTVVKEATEAEEGLEQRVCENDPSHIEERAIPCLPHVHIMRYTEAKDAACEEAGNIAYWICSTCNHYFADEAGEDPITAEETVIPATGHHFGEWTVVTEAGCETEGESIRVCANDASHTQSQKIPAIGHDWDEGTITAQPTCTEKGERTFTCKHDGTHTMTAKIPALGHSMQIHDYQAPTKEEPGNIEYWVCGRCGKYFADANGDQEITEEQTILPAITTVDLSECEVSLSYASTNFTNLAKKPTVTVTYAGEPLIKDTDYTVSYSNNKNVGTAAVTIAGTGETYTGTVTKTFKIKAVKITNVNLKYSFVYYTGKARTQTGTTVVKAKVNGKYVTLAYGTDYKIAYSNHTNVGIATITVTGKGNYTGTITKTFQIRPKATTLKSATSPSARKLTVKWAKQDTQITGYQIWYGTDSTFAKKSTKNIAKGTYTFSKTGLTSGKTYYAKVRTYKTVGGKTYYSKWSAVKSVKVK